MNNHNSAGVAAGAFLTVADMATWLQISGWSVRRLARLGNLPHHRIGTFLRFRREEVERYLDEKRHGYGGQAD